MTGLKTVWYVVEPPDEPPRTFGNEFPEEYLYRRGLYYKTRSCLLQLLEARNWPLHKRTFASRRAAHAALSLIAAAVPDMELVINAVEIKH